MSATKKTSPPPKAKAAAKPKATAKSAKTKAAAQAAPARSWTFLTNHAHVLITIARDPAVRLRDIAERVGITERGAYGIVHDLVEAGYLSRERQGRRVTYAIHPDFPLRHPVEHEHTVAEMLELLAGDH